MNSGGEWERFLYFLINLFLILLSVLLRRRVFVIFGGMGVIGYVGHLAYTVFSNSLLFPIVLSFIGVFIIFAGIQYQKNYPNWQQWLHRILPESLLQILPKDI
jgi:hypothetical protein